MLWVSSVTSRCGRGIEAAASELSGNRDSRRHWLTLTIHGQHILDSTWPAVEDPTGGLLWRHKRTFIRFFLGGRLFHHLSRKFGHQIKSECTSVIYKHQMAVSWKITKTHLSVLGRDTVLFFSPPCLLLHRTCFPLVADLLGYFCP